MKKLAICISLVGMAVSTISCVAVIPIHKCYGLPVCKQNPSECQLDKEKGLYQRKSTATCKMDGGHF
ncbi:MAG: hypothetical protein Q8L78_02720 [Coxiellaceae bacterium]|nr:hypothetical protein [Coxiellaceae bacterium]